MSEQNTWLNYEIPAVADLQKLEDTCLSVCTQYNDLDAKNTSDKSQLKNLDEKIFGTTSTISLDERMNLALNNCPSDYIKNYDANYLSSFTGLIKDKDYKLNFLNSLYLGIIKKDNSNLPFLFYKRYSNLKSPIILNFDTGNSNHLGNKDFTFLISLLDDNKTNNMLTSDINRFCSISDVSGVGSYSYSLQISSNKLNLVINLLGGGVFSVRKQGKLTIAVHNDTNFIRKNK